MGIRKCWITSDDEVFTNEADAIKAQNKISIEEIKKEDILIISGDIGDIFDQYLFDFDTSELINDLAEHIYNL